jgi:hypothetical protein
MKLKEKKEAKIDFLKKKKKTFTVYINSEAVQSRQFF